MGNAAASAGPHCLPRERPMKTFAAAFAAVTLASSLVLASGQAQAKPKFGPSLGFGLAVGSLIAAGAMASAYGRAPYVEPAYGCRPVRQFDRYGNYLGIVKVCDVAPY
jgi:hypothetical protein